MGSEFISMAGAETTMPYSPRDEHALASFDRISHRYELPKATEIPKSDAEAQPSLHLAAPTKNLLAGVKAGLAAWAEALEQGYVDMSKPPEGHRHPLLISNAIEELGVRNSRSTSPKTYVQQYKAMCAALFGSEGKLPHTLGSPTERNGDH